MARSNSIKVLRATRANLNTEAAGAGLLPGEPYLITDENRLAVGLSTTTYQDFAKLSEAGGASAGPTLGQVIAARAGAYLA